jgi:dolichol kinase
MKHAKSFHRSGCKPRRAVHTLGLQVAVMTRPVHAIIAIALIHVFLLAAEIEISANLWKGIHLEWHFEPGYNISFMGKVWINVNFIVLPVCESDRDWDYNLDSGWYSCPDIGPSAVKA